MQYNVTTHGRDSYTVEAHNMEVNGPMLLFFDSNRIVVASFQIINVISITTAHVSTPRNVAMPPAAPLAQSRGTSVTVGYSQSPTSDVYPPTYMAEPDDAPSANQGYRF